MKIVASRLSSIQFKLHYNLLRELELVYDVPYRELRSIKLLRSYTNVLHIEQLGIEISVWKKIIIISK